MPLEIDYESEGFASGALVANGAGTLVTSWNELLAAAVTVGRPNRHYVFRHGRASRYEALFRWSLVRMALEQNGPRARRLRRTAAARTLDPSEKGAVSYFLGLTLCKLFAERLCPGRPNIELRAKSLDNNEPATIIINADGKVDFRLATTVIKEEKATHSNILLGAPRDRAYEILRGLLEKASKTGQNLYSMEGERLSSGQSHGAASTEMCPVSLEFARGRIMISTS